MPPEFEITRELELPASPEQVWEAVATTAGNAAWMFPNEIDPESDAVKAWDPPNRFAVRTEQGDWFNALEYVIEAREGGAQGGDVVRRQQNAGLCMGDERLHVRQAPTQNGYARRQRFGAVNHKAVARERECQRREEAYVEEMDPCVRRSGADA